jgi:hypothetical protein
MQYAEMVDGSVFCEKLAMLVWFFWKESAREIHLFSISARRGAAHGTVEILGTPIDKPLEDFAANFNDFLRNHNAASRRINRAAAYSSFLAAATSFASADVSLRQVFLVHLVP